MRIVQVVLGFYPSQMWAGISQVVLSTSKELIRRGHQVTVLSSNILAYGVHMGPESFEGEWEGIPVIYLHAHWRGRRANSFGFVWMPDLFHYRHIIRGADIIHIHGYRSFMFVVPALLAKINQVPYVVQPHGSLPTRFGRVGLKRMFDRTLGPYLLQRAAGGIALSEAEINDFLGYGIERRKVAKIFYPFDSAVCPTLPDRSAFRQRFAIPPEKQIVLFLSRIHEKKGLDLLIEAFARLNRDDVLLCIVGPDDGFEATARRLVSQFGLQDRVLFTGALYGDAKFEAYRAADVYVLPTRGVEGLPMTIVEALYSGTPLVVTRTTEFAQAIDGCAGVAVDYDAEQLKNALAHILAHRDSFSERTSEFLTQFELKPAVDRLLQFYEMAR